MSGDTTNQRALRALCRLWGLTVEEVRVDGGRRGQRIWYANERGKPTHAAGKRAAAWHEHDDVLVVWVPAAGLPKVETVVVFGPELEPRLDVGALLMELWMGVDRERQAEAEAGG